jgi:hypothetical protein
MHACFQVENGFVVFPLILILAKTLVVDEMMEIVVVLLVVVSYLVVEQFGVEVFLLVLIEVVAVVV